MDYAADPMGDDRTSRFCRTCNRQALATRPGTNHILHLLISVFTLGLWIPMWILISIKIGGWRCNTCGMQV